MREGWADVGASGRLCLGLGLQVRSSQIRAGQVRIVWGRGGEDGMG